MIGDVLSIIFALFGTAFVIVLTYYGSKWYAKKMGPIASGKHIKVLDRVPVSKSGSVMIIDVEGKQYLIGVADNSIKLLKELDEPISLSIAPGQEMQGGNLNNMFRSLIDKVRNNERGVD